MAFTVPRGFRLAGIHTGVKRDPAKEDLTLVVSDPSSVAAGVYTQNLVHAAPVALDRQRTPATSIRTVVINSGNANACTGQRGMDDALRMVELAAEAVGADPNEALVMSTGVIGEFLPMDKIAAGIVSVAPLLNSDEASLISAVRGIMTTDTVHKIAGRTLTLDDGRTVQITGMAKGAAMIGPNMATMLGLILTDAPLTADVAQAALTEAVDESFNCISVDGHTSTNDSVLLLANGQSGGDVLSGKTLQAFSEGLSEVCRELARSIPADGEGATHLVTIDVEGCADRASAMQIAKTIAHSPLVKTAVTGADPNWGRIVSAAGYAGVPLDPTGVCLHVNGVLLYENGAPVEFDEAAVSASMRDSHDTSFLIHFIEGEATARVWTTDLTAEYVRLNADYHT